LQGSQGKLDGKFTGIDKSCLMDGNPYSIINSGEYTALSFSGIMRDCAAPITSNLGMYF
jgi:hypothetical protein